MNPLNDIIYIGCDPTTKKKLSEFPPTNHSYFLVPSVEEAIPKFSSENINPKLIIYDENSVTTIEVAKQKLQENSGTSKVPFIALVNSITLEKKHLLKSSGITDIIKKPLDKDKHELLINSLLKLNLNVKTSCEHKRKIAFRKTTYGKRAIDVSLSSTCLILTSPVFLLVSLLIKIESKGSIITKSKKVGSGYRIFTSYNFSCEKKVTKTSLVSNFKTSSSGLTKEIHQIEKEAFSNNKNPLLFGDEKSINESTHLLNNTSLHKTQLFDGCPEITLTKIGSILRKTKIEKLPQLINVFLGDLSIIGNLPLSVNDAEKRTTDEWTERFLAPAGLTNLRKIHKSNSSKNYHQKAHKQMDNEYARTFSTRKDAQLVIKKVIGFFHKDSSDTEPVPSSTQNSI
jgi:lipopolysaccharide/colanic/teichoic acid biosynthesis glycosyltransferase